MIKTKLIANNNEIEEIKAYKRKGKKIVLCHGAFDLVHPGHLSHFEEAKSYGDILVVTLTADDYIKKNIHSPFFNQEMRRDFLKNLKIIDYVFIVNDKTASPVIEKIKPNYYCKGVEYKRKDAIGNLKQEKDMLKKHRGKIIFLGKNVQSSSRLISSNLFNIDDLKFENYLKKTNFSKLEEIKKKINNVKIVVIGETIIDQYTYVKTVGVSPKSNTLSCIETQNQYMAGGTLATYKFLSSFIKNVKHISIVNQSMSSKVFIKNLFKKNQNIIKSKNYEKLIKKRIIEGNKETPLNKILTLNEFEVKELSKNDEEVVMDKLKKFIKNADLIIAQDFGHGFFTKKIVNFLQSKSKKLSINVQTNSLNYGYNIISKKFKKSDFVSLDERELQLFEGKKEINYEKSLKSLSKFLSAKKTFLTCGGKFSLMYSKNKFLKIPVLNKKAIDTMGAGDIFHSIASVMSLISKDDNLNLLISQIAGAHAVEIIGNSSYPKFSEIINTVKFYQSSLQKKKI